MEYPKKSINGDAGEYFVAHKVTRILGWPCRLYGVDLGVDAEMEVMDDNGHSTGDIIKIQIKSFESIGCKDATAVYVDDRHIEYWKRFCLPVIICCVDLSTEKIYWKRITATEAYASGGTSRKVSFCLTHDIFDFNSKSSLKKLVTPDGSKRIDELFSQLDQMVTYLPNHSAGYADVETIREMEKLCEDITKVVRQIDELITHFPWRISSMALRKLNHIRNIVRTTKNDCGYHHNNLVEGM